MAIPIDPEPRPISFPIRVPNMLNQVTFEGFLARGWIYNNQRFLRLASHRAPGKGFESDGPLTVESDYVTVRLDPRVRFNLSKAHIGQRLLVYGRIEGHDIPETLGSILRHSRLNVHLPPEYANLTVSRPAVQILGTELEERQEKKVWSRDSQSSADEEARGSLFGTPRPDWLEPQPAQADLPAAPGVNHAGWPDPSASVAEHPAEES